MQLFCKYLTTTRMIMLPIPVSIIGSNKRLLIPLLYLAVTSTFCYTFLILCTKVDPSQFPQIIPTGEAFYSLKSDSSASLTHRRERTFSKFKREADIGSYLDPYPEERKKSKLNFFTKKKPKVVFNNENQSNSDNNGTWRSHSTQVRLGDQDLIDPLASSFQPWPEDKLCSQFQTHFAKKGTFKPRALVSFPGSGNSWLRFLIECGTGLFTGSVFNDTKLYSGGLLGELSSPNDGSTIVQKTHHDALRFSSFKNKLAYVKLTELMFGYRGILLIRNPYDALLSYWNFVGTRDHRGLAIKPNFNSKKWQNFVRTLAPKWTSLIRDWVENSSSLLIVQYEKLKKNPYRELIRILRYLGQPVNEDRLKCVLKKEHMEGPFHRKLKNKNRNSSSLNNPFGMRLEESETKEKEKNFPDLNDRPELNSKSLKNYTSPTSNSEPGLPATLDLIVQENINQINQLFSEKYIPLFLNYKGPTP